MSVYTTIEQSELEDFLTHYQVGELRSFEGISDGIENTNYFVDADQRLVLTIFEHHTLDEMQYYLKLMHHLADHGVPSADPVADEGGNYIRELKGKPAALVKRLTGGSIRDTSISHCQQLGAAMGKMHSAGLSFELKQTNPRGAQWRADTASLVMDKLDAPDQLLLHAEVDFERSNPNAAIPHGVIHADLFRDNSLWDDNRLSGIIDFYYACDDALLYDVAVTVNDWCCNSDYSLDEAKTVALLTAYHEHRKLTSDEQHHWPILLRAGALRFWLSRLYDKHFPRDGELVHTKDPDEFKAIVLDRSRHHDRYQAFWV